MTARHRTAALPHRGGAATTSPWLRAPVLLMRHPAVFLAIVAATAVLTIAAASGGLFVSTLDTASLQAQAAHDCPERSMAGFGAQVDAKDAALARKQGLAALDKRQPLGTPYAVEIAFAQLQTFQITLYSRPGALDHVTKVRGVGGPGVWIPDNYVQQMHVQPGGYLRTSAGTPLRVAGIYRSMSPSPFQLPNVPRYFCNWTDLIVRTLAEHGVGPLLISDEATLARAADPMLGVQLGFYEPLPLGSIPLKDAAAAADRADAAEDDFYLSFLPGAVAPQDSTYAAAPSTGTKTLFDMIDRARDSRSGVSGSVLPIDLAGVLVAAVLVAGAGAFWANHRSREIRLLVARGVGAFPLALKAVLETLPPALLGLAGGFGAAVLIVKAVSPTSVLGPGAISSALWSAVGAIVFGLVLIAVIGAIASRERLVGAKRSWHSGVPWELALLGVAAFVGREIYAGHGVHVDKTIVQVRPALVIFPMIGSLAVLLVLGRLLAFALPRLRRRFNGGGAAFFLALRRIAGSRAISVGLIVCVAMPTALLTYTSTLTTSVQDEVHAKYRTNIGAPRVLDVVGYDTNDPDLQGHGTNVAVYQAGPMIGKDTQVYVMGVDPATFENFALVAGDQRGLALRLHARTGADVPALLVNAPSSMKASKLRIGPKSIPLHVIARREVFPGLRAKAYPLIVIDRSVLRDIHDINVDRDNQIWTDNANIAAAQSIIDKLGYHVLAEITPQVLIDTTGLLPLTWIFSYLRALAIMIGLVAVVALVFALAARTRRRTVSYVLSRRMGLTRAAHLRSLLLELAVVAGLGFLVGSGVGAGAFRVIVASLDMYPDLPPGAAFRSPIDTWAIVGAAWCAVVVLAAVGVQLLADRAKPAEILRLE